MRTNARIPLVMLYFASLPLSSVGTGQLPNFHNNTPLPILKVIPEGRELPQGRPRGLPFSSGNFTSIIELSSREMIVQEGLPLKP